MCLDFELAMYPRMTLKSGSPTQTSQELELKGIYYNTRVHDSFYLTFSLLILE